ncbi:LysR substrate-binding domain-containing protein [Mangrovicoccus sp. HB161399]|uniref:LysR substrate-binding domain-containing protein n=1 Tax=Mangrovicoccus sp. HB161399 TaxID=2720392 RepID=UPI001556414A|nr:LysR substrate-binding domain-containing protein [Mangrovicoccus sp. HB161399]
MRRFVPSHSALLAFESAARHMSFTKAAEDLAITQSGVSRQIGSLESLLGVRLFDRMGSRLVLTEPARAYLEEVTEALDRLERASVNCVRGAALDEALTVCVHPTFASRWLAPRLAGFLAGHPETVVDLHAATQDPDFSEMRVDLAVLRGRGTWAKARAQELFREQLAVVAAPGVYPGGAPRGVLDFDTFPTLQNASRPDLWLTWLRGAGLSHRGAIRGPRFPQSGMLIAAARNRLGLAVVPRSYVEAELASGELVEPLGGPVLTSDSYWMVQPEERTVSPAARAFMAWLAEEARRDRRALSGGAPP